LGTVKGQGFRHSLMIWTRLTRIPFLTGTIIPVTLGAIIAWTFYKAFNPAYFVLALVAAMCLHLGTNIINDYFDFKSGCDAINTEGLSPISGGSRVLLENLIRPRSAYFGALCFFTMAGLIGIALSVAVGWGVLLLGAIGVISGYFYVTQLATRGVGELVVGLNFGPLMVLGSYYVQNQNLLLRPLVASVPVGFLITAILWINEIPDYTADKAVGKKTLVVRVGRKRGADLYAAIVMAAYAWTAVMVVLKQMPLASVIVLITLPLAMKAITTARKYSEKPQSMITANLSTIRMHLLFGVLLVIGYVLSTFWSVLG
jgi:1,4-dihydroxy-2-naphthoate octaprenyltransferase